MKKGLEQNLGFSPNISEIGREPLPGTDLNRGKKEKPYKGTLTPNGLIPRDPEIEQDFRDGKEEIARKQKLQQLDKFEKENGFAVDNLILDANGLADDEKREEAIAETLDPRTQLQRKINTKAKRYEELQKSANDLAAKMKGGQSDNPEEDENLLYTLQNEMLEVGGKIAKLKSEQRDNLFNPIRTQTKKTKEQL